jgi:hypothetical protein
MKTGYFILSVLIISAVAVYGQQANRNYLPPKHYTGVINTGNNMTIGIPDYAWENTPGPGDEIGAFNSKNELAGSSVYIGGHSAVAIWGDDETTNNKEGVQSGERFTLRLWSQATGIETLLEVENWVEGDNIYKSNGISIVGKLKSKPLGDVVPAEYALMQNSPNPVLNMTNIKFSLPKKVYVEFSLYTAGGEFVEKFYAAEMPAGQHSFEFDSKKYAAGNYSYKMTTPDFSATKNMSIIR